MDRPLAVRFRRCQFLVIHVDLETGKAIRPEEQKYLDESGQPLGFSMAPAVPDEALLGKK